MPAFTRSHCSHHKPPCPGVVRPTRPLAEVTEGFDRVYSEEAMAEDEGQRCVLRMIHSEMVRHAIDIQLGQVQEPTLTAAELAAHRTHFWGLVNMTSGAMPMPEITAIYTERLFVLLVDQA